MNRFTQVDKEFDEKFVCTGGTKYCPTTHEPMLKDDVNVKNLKSFLYSQLDKQRREIWEKLGIKDGHSCKCWRDKDEIYFADEDSFKIKVDSSLQSKLGGKELKIKEEV